MSAETVTISATPFQMVFKAFKNRSKPIIMENVLDFTKIAQSTIECDVAVLPLALSQRHWESLPDHVAATLTPLDQWQAYILPSKPGFIFLCNHFTAHGHRMWCQRALAHYTNTCNACNLDPHHSNIHGSSGRLWLRAHPDAHVEHDTWISYQARGREDQDPIASSSPPPSLSSDEVKCHSSELATQQEETESRTTTAAHAMARGEKRRASQCQDDDDNGDDDVNAATTLLYNLRWVTLGYHYDWTNKVYDQHKHTVFPSDLASLVRVLASAVGFTSFEPEAAIVNFYHLDSTLSGHTDHSEFNHTAPLLSFSMGHDAIFLFGGTTRDETPIPVLVRSGDIVVMSGSSRLCYHAVPRVLDTIAPHLTDSDCPPHKPTQLKQRRKQQQQQQPCRGDPLDCVCEKHWNPFARYMSQSRINFNVRQVLFDDHKWPT